VGNVTETKKYKTPKGGRLILGVVSIIGMLLSLAFFILGTYVKFDFVPMLIALFLFALGACHAWAAFANNLTQSNVRKIDYWYLGAAAVGMFVFAAGYGEQREAAASRTREYVHRQTELTFQVAVTKALMPYMLTTCKDEFQRDVSDKPCALSESISEAMQPNTSSYVIEHYLRRLATVRSEVMKRGDNPEFDKMTTAVGASLVAFEKWAEANPLRQPFVPIDEAMRVWSGIGQYFIWPLLLAFALALRITKVTIDVYEWAK
jgi:hypothetical protein